MNETQKQVEEWLDKKNWKHVDFNLSDARFNVNAGFAVVACVWGTLSTIIYTIIMSSVTSWDSTDSDPLPPHMGLLMLSGLAVIAAACAAMNIVLTQRGKNARSYPKHCTRTQCDAADTYGTLQPDDQKRLRPALISFLVCDRNVDGWSVMQVRENVWLNMVNKINEKNRLKRQLEMAPIFTDAIELESSMLDDDIKEMQDEISLREPSN